MKNSNSNKSTNSSIPNNTQTPQKSGKKDEQHFSSSAFLNSPDPSALPIPVFDDESTDNGINRKGIPNSLKQDATKTDALRSFLNMRNDSTK
jgi:hypothetical protein